jgi:hypothetical protein
MRTRRPRSAAVARSAFAGFCFPPDVIVLAVRWYLRFAQLLDRGLWVGLAQHNDQRTRRQEYHDRMSLNHERTPPTGVPQLTGYLTRDFLKGK